MSAVVTSLLQKFPHDLEDRLAGNAGDPNIAIGPLSSIVGGTATLAATNGYTRPDWTLSKSPVRFGS